MDRLRWLSLPLVFLLGCSSAFAQTQDFTDWVYKRLEIASQAAVAATSPTKQVETPSIAEDSTSLVDQSDAPDLIGLALQFFNLGGGSDASPASITVSAFTLRTAILGTDPMRPEVYAAGRNWRRFSVSVGRQARDVVAGRDESDLVGVKILAWDRRDPTSPSNVALLQGTIRNSGTGQQVAQAIDALLDLISSRLAPRFGETDLDVFIAKHLGKDTHAATLEQLTPAELEEIDRLLVERVAPAMQSAMSEQQKLVKRLRLAPQLAFSYQAKLADDTGDDEHAWQGIFDYGVVNRLNLSVNAGMSRINRALLDDEMVVRLSAEFQFRLTGDSSNLAGLLRTRTPLTISVAVASAWHGEGEDIHKAQVKLRIPLPGPLKGVSLPVSVTVANRTELIDERDVRGQLGFTIDFSKFQQALRSSLR
jgi:hypothetical protein